MNLSLLHGKAPLAVIAILFSLAETLPAQSGRIAFRSTRDSNSEIYIMDANGANQTRLTRCSRSVAVTGGNASFDGKPAFSPDGRRIAFTSWRDGNAEIYLMNANGTGQRRLTYGDEISRITEADPSFSPDGTRLLFTTTRDHANPEIYVMAVDGSSPVRLTSNTVADREPVFSPNGLRIAFTRVVSSLTRIFIMDANGANAVQLTASAGADDGPAFSPDGSKIVFASDRDGNREIYVMNADGTGQTRLTSNTFSDYDPMFSPDGQSISFTSNRDGNEEIYLMTAAGANPVRLTNNTAVDTEAAWAPVPASPAPLPQLPYSPLGKIAWESGRDGTTNEIYIMTGDGLNQTRLTDDPAGDFAPDISPDGSRIVFTRGTVSSEQVWIMNVDGSGQTQLTTTSTNSRPSFTRDGTRILFDSFRDGNREIYVMNADGTAQTRLTNNTATDQDPISSPDGTKILFTTNRDGNVEVYQMDANGANPVNLTNNAANDSDGNYSPDGTKILFTTNRANVSASAVYMMDANGANPTPLLTSGTYIFNPRYSPGASHYAFATFGDMAQVDVFSVPTSLSGGRDLCLSSGDDRSPCWASSAAPRITTVARLPSGTVRLNGQGSAFAVHRIQTSGTLLQGSFGPLGNATADANGLFQIEDTAASGFTKRFYRISY